MSSGVNDFSQLGKTQDNLNTAFTRLSSGLKINSARDDAAGFTVSDRMNSQIRALNQAIRNAGDGLSLTQTADSALSESTDLLQRMRELAVQSGNGSYNASDRASMNGEFSRLRAELGRIAEQTSFNDRILLDGSMTGGVSFQVGASGGESIKVSLGSVVPAGLGMEALFITTVQGAQEALGVIDEAIVQVSGMRGELGAVQSRFDSTIANLSSISENVTASRSRVADADVAAEISKMVKNSILQRAGIAVQAQSQQVSESVLGLLS